MTTKKFDENSRVKIPAIIHLVRLGYTYLSKKNNRYDSKTNIFKDIFNESIKKINKEIDNEGLIKIYDKISSSLKNDDLGEEFYKILTSENDIKLLDFNNFENNTFNVVTELKYENDGEEFRPDITVLINGMPLAFIEVKIPNNKDGILVEQERMQSRFKKKEFKNFINITQLIIFSNNMNYDDNSHLPIEGSFYLTPSYNASPLNYFREEEKFNFHDISKNITDEEENFILEDNNLVTIKNSKEFITNKDPQTPTNKICTSLLQKKRIEFLLRFGIAYVSTKKGIEKHIMRYPQIFAAQQIKNKIDKGINKGVIWHTQGSGKTALTYYSLKYLLNYFRSKKKISKYYFIVDRIDLVTQANKEFRSRGLSVHNIESKKEFSDNIKSNAAIHNANGNDEIIVVNIQKFDSDESVIKNNDYNLDIQRIYFIDEVHRGYTDNGTFLASLEESDRNAIKIGLTGTPTLNTDGNTRRLFGDYIHKYFYNRSIIDGYTLRLIREIMETHEKKKLEKILEEIKVKKGSINKAELYSKEIFVEPLLDYIINDFERFRILNEDNSVGAMVVCDSGEQATTMNKIFVDKYKNITPKISDTETYHSKILRKSKVTSGALILHDEGSRDERKDIVEEFKDGEIDILFVNRMLLTGFDAPRLKKIYLARKIESKNLLQALTRVNRTYKNFRYGYVVDFVGIQEEFDKTNEAYLKELEEELGDEIENYNSILKSELEIDNEIKDIKKFLFKFDTENIENFTTQLIQINDKKDLLKIVNSLKNIKELYNHIRLKGEYGLLKKIDFKNFSNLYKVANRRLNYLNEKISHENKESVKGLLNLALMDVEAFTFTKIGEKELKLADQYKDLLQRVIDEESKNIDPSDPVYISLKEELERLFKLKNIKDASNEIMEKNSKELESTLRKFKELNRNDQLLSSKYNYDNKYVRLHKDLLKLNKFKVDESDLFNALKDLKNDTDKEIIQNTDILNNENFIEKKMSRIIYNSLKEKNNLEIDTENTKYINKFIRKEYINEFHASQR